MQGLQNNVSDGCQVGFLFTQDAVFEVLRPFVSPNRGPVSPNTHTHTPESVVLMCVGSGFHSEISFVVFKKQKQNNTALLTLKKWTYGSDS